MSMHNAYDVPEDREPRRSAFTKETSKVNSSVNGFRSISNTPTQNPTHIGQPKKACEGRTLSKIEAKTIICVSP
jgi:hypothetical protein